MSYIDSECAYRLLGVYHIHRPPRSVANASRAFVAIGFRIKGTSEFKFDGGTLTASEQSAVFFPAGTSFRSENESAVELIAVHLKPLGKVSKSFCLYENAGETEPLFRKLLAKWESGDYNRCMAILYEIFSMLERPSEPIPQVIEPGVTLMRRDFKNPAFTVAQAAKASFVSEVYFRRIYHKHFGESPLQTIRNLRFQYACSLLDSGYYTCKQIAELSGFSDVKYFRTAFKKEFGETPLKYAEK
jgi:AraC-like DNA-binding protein